MIQKKNILYLLIVNLYILNCPFSFSQQIFYQEIFRGGVTGGGFSTSQGVGSGSIELHIEPGSIIRKAYILAYSYGDFVNENLIINGTIYNFSSTSEILSVNHIHTPISPVGIHVLEITDELNANLTSIFNIDILLQDGMPFNGVFAPYICVLYENINLQPIVVNMLLNNKDFIGNENYLSNNLNPINVNSPVGFALYTDRAGQLDLDGTIVTFNNNQLGLVGGADNVNSQFYGGAVKGHFYYQNNQLFGLDDDIPNTVMDSTDGLADVSSYIVNNATSCNFNLQHVQYPNLPNPAYPNINLAYFLTYTTPCDTFSTTLTHNVSICKGDTAFLEVTGGASTPLSHPTYEWLPQVGLSCYNCATPYYTDTVGRVYTCRIWNTDSCSKVLPVKINILPLPSMPTIAVNPTLCSGNTGHIQITNQPTIYTYTLDGGTPQTTLHFNNLSAGNHTLQITANNGCSRDTVLTINEINNVVAQFTASPTSGNVPLSVNFTNQSTNANNYIWYIENDTLITTQANHTFDTSGVFTVTLVAYNTYPHCSDTAVVTIVAEYPFSIIAPSLYIGDEQYSPYQIYTSGVKELHYELFNDQGKLVYQKVLMPTNGNLSLWNSNQLAKGIYLYRIWAVDDDGVEKVITGKVVVM